MIKFIQPGSCEIYLKMKSQIMGILQKIIISTKVPKWGSPKYAKNVQDTLLNATEHISKQI